MNNEKKNHLDFSNINRLWSYLVINEINAQDVSGFYPSPGLRNAPLLWAITKVDNEKVFSGLDERSQSFRALGACKKTGLPSVLLCTSGTAMANYYPAVIEAQKDNLPLIIISSDRPDDLVWGDHNQTITQENLYGNFVLEAVDLGLPSEDISPQVLTTKVAQLIHKAKFQGGPIHINIRFREPLDHTVKEIDKNYLEKAHALLNSSSTSFHPLNYLAGELPSFVIDKLSSAKKPLITVGGLRNINDQTISLFRELTDKLGGHFHFDITSSLKFIKNNSEGQIPSPDHPEVLESLKADSPDLILHFGSRITSKFYYQWLSNEDIPHIHFGTTWELKDPSGTIDHKVFGPIDAALGTLISTIENHSISPRKSWLNWDQIIAKKESVIEEAPLSFAYISKKAIELASVGSQFYIGNSSIIRSFNNYSTTTNNKNFKVFSNRGVSGIEGFISSAIGLSEQSHELTYLFIGDVSALHDINALHLPSNNLKIIILNNSGGGIFKLLPINNDSDQSYLDLLTTPHQSSFNDIAKAFKVKANSVATKDEFLQSFKDLAKSKETEVLEVIIDDQNNIDLFHQLKTIK
ncbi:MAG: 2-succinyl-5-enolpyruvyl-6-hydroxy-3-cyclohexene-1-carboxylic-acid synthase [Oligoflexia bacterium]|nr:2-succinyl-5-enolpyruvyl-6-hydroxy-3-cyclohexene-1-carboxylic-acid synthase [Oligoflexia bacterium]